MTIAKIFAVGELNVQCTMASLSSAHHPVKHAFQVRLSGMEAAFQCLWREKHGVLYNQRRINLSHQGDIRCLDLRHPLLMFCALNHKYHDYFAHLCSSIVLLVDRAISLRDTAKFIIVTLRLFHKFIISLLFHTGWQWVGGLVETLCLR